MLLTLVYLDERGSTKVLFTLISLDRFLSDCTLYLSTRNDNGKRPFAEIYMEAMIIPFSKSYTITVKHFAVPNLFHTMTELVQLIP